MLSLYIPLNPVIAVGLELIILLYIANRELMKMAKISIDNLFKTLGLESADVVEVKAPKCDGVAEVVPEGETDNNKVSIRELMEEQAEGHVPDDVIEVKEGDITVAQEELEGETIDGVDDTAYMEPEADYAEDTEEAFNDLDEVEGATAALEAYADILQGMQRKGYEVSVEMAAVMQIGLESIDANMFSNVVVSVEDADAGESSSKSTLDKVLAKLKELWEIAKKIAAKALAQAANFWNYVATNTKPVALELANALVAFNKATDVPAKVELTNASALLQVDGKLTTAAAVTELAEIVEKLAVQYPSAIHAGCMELESDLRKYDDFAEAVGGGGISDEQKERMANAIPMKRVHNLFGNVGVSIGGDDSAVAKSKAFLGNKQLVITAIDAETAGGLLKSGGLQGDWFKVSFNSTEGGSVENASYDTSEVKATGIALGKLLKALDVGAEMRKTSAEVQKQFAKELPGKNGLTGDFVVANIKARAMKEAIRYNVQLVGHALRVIKAHIALIKHISATEA